MSDLRPMDVVSKYPKKITQTGQGTEITEHNS